jgi:hypothetical protein
MTIGVLVDEMEGALMLAGLVVAAGAVFAVALCGLSR